MTENSPLKDINLKDIPKYLHLFTEDEQARLLEELEVLENLKNKELAQLKFMSFVRKVWPTFIGGRHHEKMAAAFERVASGEIKRLIINMPPRHTKSEFASYLLPAWFLGKFQRKRSSRRPIPLSSPLDLVVRLETLWTQKYTSLYSQAWGYKATQKLLDDGPQTLAVITLRLVLEAQLRVKALTYLLLTTHTVNRKRR